MGSKCRAPGRVAVPSDVSSFPGGKSGSGIYQRLINLIPRHRILVSAFAGRCGVTRHIRPAEHSIVIDADPNVCQWWDSWRRTKQGRALEIHHCDSIEWLRYRFGLTEYSAAGSGDARAIVTGSRTIRRPVMASAAEHCDTAATHQSASHAADAQSRDSRPPIVPAAETFIFCDPPYVLAARSGGRIYDCELSDERHSSLLAILTRIPRSAAAVMLCGYRSPIYAAVDRAFRHIDHQVPTRGGLQQERIWMNYDYADQLHDYQYIGDCRRSRERIRRRQKNWASQLSAMPDPERAAMLETLQTASLDAARNIRLDA